VHHVHPEILRAFFFHSEHAQRTSFAHERFICRRVGIGPPASGTTRKTVRRPRVARDGGLGFVEAGEGGGMSDGEREQQGLGNRTAGGRPRSAQPILALSAYGKTTDT
jgi:hypothetical protein